MSVECHLKIHHFEDKLSDTVVHFHVINMKNCYFIWIGSVQCDFSNLTMAMPTKYDKMPLSTNLLGSASDATSQALAQKLSKKSKKQVFVSYNLMADYVLLPLVEQRIFEEIKINPEYF